MKRSPSIDHPDIVEQPFNDTVLDGLYGDPAFDSEGCEPDFNPDDTEPAILQAADESGQDGEDALTLYLRDIGRVPLLSAAEELELAKSMSNGNTAARQRLIEANLRLVVRIACRYQISRERWLDLIQAGNRALMRSVGGFDHTRGFRFSTYIFPHIRSEVHRAYQYDRLVHLPEYVTTRLNRARRLIAAGQLDPQATPDEAAKYLRLSTEDAAEVMMLLQGTAIDPLRLDEPTGDAAHSRTFAEDLENPDQPLLDELIPDLLDQRAVLHAMLSRLNAQQRQVMELRFGLDEEGKERERPEVGRLLGITRERVRQVEKVAWAALLAMRHDFPNALN